MLLDLIKNAGSMIASPERMNGRSWGTELMVRTTRNLFHKGNERGLDWLRARFNSGTGYHPAVSKISMNTRDVAGVSCMLASPKDGASSNTVIVYMHGGGYVSGSPQSHKPIIAQLAAETMSLVIAPDYRLAPEHPYPAPQDDCLSVTRAVLKTYSDKKVVLAGDSAGGALAIATALELCQEQADIIDKLVLLSPWVEPTAVGGSLKSNEKHDFLLPAFLSEHFANLMQNSDYHDARVNFAQVDLPALPRTLVQYGGGEVFLDQIEAFCERAKASGVDLSMRNYPTQFHVFQLFSAVLKDAKVAMAEIIEFIKD